MCIRKLVPAAFALGLWGTTACQSDDGNTQLGYELGFPSTQAAIATENVKVYVFPKETRCLELVQNILAGGALPASVAETPSQNMCTYFTDEASSVRIALEAGEYNVLALGTRAGENFLVGCAAQNIDGSTEAVPISMVLVDAARSVPQSPCQLVADKCVEGKSC